VVAVDRWGNVAALVHSSNTPLWGDSGLVVDGIPLPAPASTYRFELTRLAPGARVPSEMAPLIVEQDGKPAFAVAAIGSSVVPETVRLVAALSARAGQTTMLSQTLGAPPLLLNYEDQTSPMLERAEYVPAGRYPADVLRRLRLRGLRIREVEGQRVQYIRGTAAVATIADGARHGAEAPGVFSFVAPE
jgi:gamma-glutamyltranspeptidase/glutathione hydrolase